MNEKKNHPHQTEATGRTTISASRRFARIVGELARDDDSRIQDFIDTAFLPLATKLYSKMLDRKTSAIKTGA